MHPKNIFQVRPMMTLLSALLLAVGPCQFAFAWASHRDNQALAARGVEVMARVVRLDDSERIRTQTAASDGPMCRWDVEAEGRRCSEIFALPCPEGITETPMIFLPAPETLCRVLSRQAVLVDPEPLRTMRFAGWLTGLALVVLFLARQRFFGGSPQARLKDHE